MAVRNFSLTEAELSRNFKMGHSLGNAVTYMPAKVSITKQVGASYNACNLNKEVASLGLCQNTRYSYCGVSH
jgi:hypothetical protein